MKYRAVIFDWDGTVVDSISHIADSLHLAANDLGLPILEKSAYRNIIGLGMMDALKALYPDANQQDMIAMRDAYGKYFSSKPAMPQHVFQGMEELILDLKAGGSGRAVATGKSRRGLDRALSTSGLAPHFDVSRCADESGSKPDPKMLTEILAHFDLEPADAVMIGDTSYDLEMAQRLNMPSIGVSWGAHSTDTLMQYDPVSIVTDIGELRKLLDLV
ncbi:MAG: HAD-IA family hydrolase [Pseudohongiellaceae bacterium]|nr:HAD-IA family hydrolase [Pseudohongiellaceae bacterium]